MAISQHPHPAVIGALLFVGALNLRPAVTTVGPLLPQLGPDLAMAEGTQGLLTALPLISFGLVSPWVPALTRRIGHERSIIVSMCLIAVGALTRSTLGLVGLWVGTVVIGMGICIGNVVMPVLVRRDHPRRISLATGVYSTCVTLGAAASFAVAVPASRWLGWRGSMGLWAIPALLVGLFWIARTRLDEISGTGPPQHGPSMWRVPRAWVLTVYFGLQSAIFYSVSGWWVTIETAAGASARTASIHLVVLQLVGGASGLLIPMLMRDPSFLLAASLTVSGAMAIGVAGMLLWPGAMLVWAAIVGAGTGATFVVALTMISFAGRSQEETTRLSGMAQSVGYLLAATGPFALGQLAQLSGGWSVPLGLLLAITLTHLVLGFPASRSRSPEMEVPE